MINEETAIPVNTTAGLPDAPKLPIKESPLKRIQKILRQKREKNK